jgi:hypothetical protein
MRCDINNPDRYHTLIAPGTENGVRLIHYKCIDRSQRLVEWRLDFLEALLSQYLRRCIIQSLNTFL